MNRIVPHFRALHIIASGSNFSTATADNISFRVHVGLKCFSLIIINFKICILVEIEKRKPPQTTTKNGYVALIVSEKSVVQISVQHIQKNKK